MHTSAVASRSGVNVSHFGPDTSQFSPSEPQSASSQTLFDSEVPVSVKQLDREEVHQPLGICVSVGRGGSSGLSKCVNVRLTDPRDPFFLYSMTLLEDDYGRFKERHELMVDFNGFPRDLVQMLSGIGTGGNNNMVTFVADNKEGCVLRILERTEFRALEHIALSMSRQGDVGQKKHLAERFQFYLAAFTRSEQQAKEETQHYERLLAECRTDIRKLTQERDQLADRTKNDAATAASNQVAALSTLKDIHASELKQLHATLEDTRLTLNRKIEAAATQHEAEMKEKEAEISQIRSRLATAESTIASLTSQLRIANDKVSNLSTELDHTKKENESLSAYRQSATQRLSDQELSAVTSTERIRHLTETLRSREEDLKALREAQGSQDGYAKMLAGQLTTLQEKLKVSEASLAKAHHILGSQVQAIRAAKEKQQALKGQVDANETLIGEKNNLVERLRGDLMNSSDKVEHLQGKVTELKNQLMKAEDQNAELAKQLKASSDAIVHLQRSPYPQTRAFGSMVASGSSSLNHTTTASGLGPLGNAFSSENLYRQFAEGTKLSGANIAPPSAGTLSSSISSPTAGITTNNQLLTGYNSLTAGMTNRPPVPTAARSPLAPSTLGSNTSASVSYLPPKASLGITTEKPSSYFGN